MGGFSKDGDIPWLNEDFAKEDLRRFKEITDGNTVIMGRITYNDITTYAKSKGFFDKHKKILPNRECIVLSRNGKLEVDDGITVKNTLRKAIDSAPKGKDIFIIGGERLYSESLSWNIDTIYVTLIDKDYKCDKFFPIKVFNDKKFHITKGEFSKHDDMKFIEYKPTNRRR